jgi:hypothetical protein
MCGALGCGGARTPEHEADGHQKDEASKVKQNHDRATFRGIDEPDSTRRMT